MDPRSVEEVFLQFKGRRTALLRALTTDFDEVYEQCDPANLKKKLCLYGHPGERWEVNFPGEEVNPVLPQPLMGINVARDAMDKRDWLHMLAIHSDTWLLAVAFSFSSIFGHDKADRSRLFDMINELPTIFEEVVSQRPEIFEEVVLGKAMEPPKQKPTILEANTPPKLKPTILEEADEPPKLNPKILQIVSGKANEPPKQKPKVRNDNDSKPKRKYLTRAALRNGKEEVVVNEGYIE